jgi:signal transduction histidine kinase/CheY-like chemotaxis protein
MTKKPTYEELEQRVKELEEELQDHKRLEDALKDYVSYKSVLAALRDVKPGQTEGVLLQTFLSEMVQQYGFCMSWYGEYSDGTIRPILSAGRVDRYLDSLVLEIREPTSPEAQCAMSQAIIKGVPFSYGDLERDEGFRGWRDYALELGYGSNLALPVTVDGQVQGGVMVYADTANAFPEERIERLQLLTLEIGAILGEWRRKHSAEEALRKACEEVEKRVQERTAELLKANERLHEEIEKPKRAEKAVRVDYDQSIVYAKELKEEIEQHKRAKEEKKSLEAHLLQAQKMEAIATLAGGVAHDFNNLLMGIQGNVSLMLMNIDSTHPHYERLKKMEKHVQSGDRLTSHLLGYARRGKYEVKPVNLNHLVKRTSETFGRTRKEITIHRELADDLFAIEADSGQIEQVLLNLFVNAADAMPGGGDLVLKTMNGTHKDIQGKLYDPKPGKYVLLTVTDTGVGMDKETTERVFDPFFTTKEMSRGTGLGLASVYGIIKGHGGYIEVASKKGQGATFSIYLPRSEREVQEALKTAKSFIQESKTVLLVDDEEIILEVGKELLEGMGYRVLIAKDGKEAVEVYEKDRNEIDIVILDMVMPNMVGGQAYDRLKEINPDIKVLLSSGFSIDGEASEILERGCNGFVQKPFTIKELSGKVSEILDTE